MPRGSLLWKILIPKFIYLAMCAGRVLCRGPKVENAIDTYFQFDMILALHVPKFQNAKHVLCVPRSELSNASLPCCYGHLF